MKLQERTFRLLVLSSTKYDWLLVSICSSNTEWSSLSSPQKNSYNLLAMPSMGPELGNGNTQAPVLTSLVAQWQKLPCQCRRRRLHSSLRKISWRRKWIPTPIFLPGKSHEQRSLVDYSPRDHEESDTTEWLTLLCYRGPNFSNHASYFPSFLSIHPSTHAFSLSSSELNCRCKSE